MTSIRARRSRVVIAALASVVLAAVVIVAIMHRHSDDAATAPTPTPSRSAPRPATFPVGITFGGALTGRSRRVVDAALDDVVALHMGWIRIDLSWADMQPRSAASYAWSATDQIVASAQAHGLSVLGLLTYTPSWARRAGCSSIGCAPRSDAAFGRFAAAVVTRYAPRGVLAYQVWNEPNLGLFWRDPDARAYGALLRTSVTAMRAAHRGLRVLFGSLAQVASTDGNVAPGAFLSRACPCPVDAVGFDPYTYPALPGSTSRPLNAWQLMTNPTAASYGVRKALPAGLKIWVTQYGAPTTYPGGDDSRLVGEARQARILTDGLRLARQSQTVIGAYFVNTWRDTATHGALRDHFGLEESDGTHKAAFAALQKALAP